jgi:hypothetical protein
MIVKKLHFPDKETADIAIEGIQAEAIVHVGKIIDVEGTYDDEGNEITPPTFIEGWHVDIMLKEDVDFGEYEVFPNNPKHKFFEL